MNKQPKLLNLTQDFSFKSFFSKNEQVLISLLKNFLPISDNISDVVILNSGERDKENDTLRTEETSIILPDTIDEKHIALDLKIRLSSGENINVEIQAFSHKNCLQRIMLYWAEFYKNDIGRVENCYQAVPTYSLTFTTSSLFGEEFKDSINSFSLISDKPPYIQLGGDLHIITAELNKLPKDYKQLLDLREKWCYFLSHSSTLTEEEYQYLSQDEKLKIALEHLYELSKDESLHQKALSREKLLRAR